MARKRKNTADKMVNVGVRLPTEAKKKLLNESVVTGIAEGTLARNYLLLGMQMAQQRKAFFNPVLSQILTILEKCSPSVQLQALDIAQVLAGSPPQSPPRPPVDSSLYPEENAPVEFLVAHEG